MQYHIALPTSSRALSIFMPLPVSTSASLTYIAVPDCLLRHTGLTPEVPLGLNPHTVNPVHFSTQTLHTFQPAPIAIFQLPARVYAEHNFLRHKNKYLKQRRFNFGRLCKFCLNSSGFFQLSKCTLSDALNSRPVSIKHFATSRCPVK